MSGLLDTLNIGRTTVDAARAGVQLVSHNIANANTAGFTRRRLQLSAVTPPPVMGGGVQVDGAARVSDELLARRVILSTASDAEASAQEAVLRQLEQSLANLGEGGLGDAISKLMAKLSALSTSPQDMTTREEVLAAASRVAETFNSVARSAGEVTAGADQDIGMLVPEVNRRAGSIAALNAEIVQARAQGNGQEPSDLLDRRDLLASELASLVGATSFLDGTGQMTVLVGGQTLVQANSSAVLEAVPDAALGGRNRIDLVKNLARVDLTTRIESGNMGGLIEVRDCVIPSMMSKVDSLASDLASMVNATHSAGFGLDGFGGRVLFTPPPAPPGAAGTAALMQLRPGITAAEVAASSTAAGVPGNGENALALARLATGLHAAGGTATFSGQAAAIVGAVGTAAAESLHNSAVRADELEYLRTLQTSVSGVSVDEEMVLLVEYQRSYQAGAKILSVVDDLLGTLLGI